MIGYIKALLRVAPFKTLYLNYRLFPLKIAVRLPIVVGRGTIIRKVGKVVLDCPVQTGLMTIGVSYLFNDKRTNQGIWDNAGTIVLAGKVTVHTGISLYTRKNGKILMGGGNRLGINTLICSEKLVRIGENTGISWNCQITDSDFHYMEDMESNKVYHKCKPVCIGSNVWIGNHVSITKGTVIADGCIVASCSVVNKQFHTANTLIAGVPAQEKKKGLKRIFSYERELALDKLFD